MKHLTYCFAAALLAACTSNHHHSHESHEAKESHGHHHHHESLIELAEEQAQRLGVKYETVTVGEFATVIQCSGIIERSASNTSTATAPTSGIIRLKEGITPGRTVNRGETLAYIDASAVSGGDNNRAAFAALEAARRELARIEPLYQAKLATQSEYNAAVAAVQQAEAAYSPAASSGCIVAPASGVITELTIGSGANVNAGDPIATISADTKLTLHAEVPAGDFAALSNITDARIGDFTLSEHGGRRSGISAENGYACIFFTFDNDGSMLPGSGAGVYLLGEPRSGVIAVPVGAVVEQQGEYFVYVRHSPGHYVKHAVKLGASDGRRVEIITGLHDGDKVVTEGAITVRLAENSGAIPEGHSHSH